MTPKTIGSRPAGHLLLVGTLLMLAACASGPGKVDGLSIDTFQGRLPDGAEWIAELPSEWNGVLLLYAHGYDPALEPAASAPSRVRDDLLDRGYALAGSAYPTAGWAVAEAIPSQLLALEAFTERYGEAERVVAWGSSMGGLVTSALAERHGEQIDGAITLCASSMGAIPMMNMALDGATALNHLLALDPPVEITGVGDNREGVARAMAATRAARQTQVGRARVALAGVLAGIPDWTRSDHDRPARSDYEAREEEIAAAIARGVYLPRGDQEKRAGGVFSWNTGVDYQALLNQSGRRNLVEALYARAGLDLAKDLDKLNRAPRIQSDPGAVRYMHNNFTPSGVLTVPVLTVHTIGDGLTSPSLQASYVDKVRAAGFEALVAEAWIDRPGHCSQTAAELLSAVQAMEKRLDTGTWDTSPAKMNQGWSGEKARFIDYSIPSMPRHPVPNLPP